MLTIDFSRLELEARESILDLGCGRGRHAFEAYRRGARVVAADPDREALAETAAVFAAMDAAGQGGRGGAWFCLRADAVGLPFADGAFDRIVVSEVLEHIPDDSGAFAELFRVLRPGGTMAVTVPRWFPELVCWLLSDRYHERPGGHVRIYGQQTLRSRAVGAGFRVLGSGYAHALHAPYWWLRCALGVDRDDRLPTRLYHRVLTWQIVKRPPLLDRLERTLDPVLGKSLVLYLRKEATPVAAEVAGRAA